jgi:hypothetical protein
MRKDRIVYQDWIVSLGGDPSLTWEERSRTSGSYNQTIIRAVNQALESLTEEEAGIVRCYYFQGMSYQAISDLTGRAIYRLGLLHNRALKKLKKKLAATLGGEYQIPFPGDRECPLCCHPRKAEIDALIQTKGEAETWRRISGTLRGEFGIRTITPQQLKAHQKYHIT